MKLTTEAWEGIVSSIYEAAILPELWPEVLLKIGGPIDCHIVQLFAQSDRNRILLNLLSARGGIDEQARCEYERTILEKLNPRNDFALRQRPMSVAVDHMHTGSKEMRRHPFYRGVASRYDFYYYGGTLLERSADSFMGMATCRSRRQGHLEEPERRYLESLAPHLRKSLKLVRIGRSRSLLEDPVGTVARRGRVILDTRGEAVEANETARAILARRDGIALERRLLDIEDRTARRAYLADLGSILRNRLEGRVHSPARIACTRRGGFLPYLLTLVPLTNVADLLGGYRCLVLITDAATSHVDLSMLLQHRYRLTPAESRLAMALHEGQSLSLFAEHRGLSVQTPRTQLKSIFSKLGVRSQSGLIRLLSSLAGDLRQ